METCYWLHKIPVNLKSHWQSFNQVCQWMAIIIIISHFKLLVEPYSLRLAKPITGYFILFVWWPKLIGRWSVCEFESLTQMVHSLTNCWRGRHWSLAQSQSHWKKRNHPGLHHWTMLRNQTNKNAKIGKKNHVTQNVHDFCRNLIFMTCVRFYWYFGETHSAIALF